MRIRLLLDVDFKSPLKAPEQIVVQAARVLQDMVNKEFQDPHNGLMLYIRSITRAPEVHVPKEVIPPREAPIEPQPIVGVPRIDSARYARRMAIDWSRTQRGIRRLYDPQTGRRLERNG